MSSLSSLPGLKYGTRLGGTSTLSPVFGLRPLRGSRLRRRKLPKPRSSIFSPRLRASMMLSKTVSTMTSECFFVRSDTRDTSSTSSAFVIGFGWGGLQPARTSLVLQVIAKRRTAVALRGGVRLPVGADIGILHRADTETDLPLRRAELDDLHLVTLLDLEVDLLPALRVVELADVNQPLDALVQLHEGAEVGHAHDLAFDRVARLVPREEVFPDIGRKLLQPQRQALVLGVDAEHHGLDYITFFQHFTGMLDALAPRHVADVNQAVDVVLDLDEGA